MSVWTFGKLLSSQVQAVVESQSRREIRSSARPLPEKSVASTLIFSYPKTMEVHFTPEQEDQLSQIAANAGTHAEWLVKNAALGLLKEDARFRAAVREGVAQADCGEFIEEAEMDARLEQMLRS
ncbi:MAG: hypothetical protein ABI383_02605 [Acidobacteriaceae bacterium]